MLIYPAIDLKDGQAVRLLHGEFEKVTVYDDDPFTRLDAFEKAGAEWVHVVDLDGARLGAPQQHSLVANLAAAAEAYIQTGGGVRERDDVERLLDTGARSCCYRVDGRVSPQGSARLDRAVRRRSRMPGFGRPSA